MANKIALQCAWGNYFGSGHIQRMGSLLNYLTVDKKIQAKLITSPPPPFSLDEIHNKVSSEIEKDTDLIIRDIRDSTVQEIEDLKKIAPVIVIDDCGEGRKSADLAVDLLPNLKYPRKHETIKEAPFIYGYNFTKAITELPHKEFIKDIDFCIYAGFDAAQEYRNFLISLIPDGASAVILDGKESTLLYHGKTFKTDMVYPFPMLFGKNLISHFGITLFEGDLCGCRIFTINPEDYHSQLADNAAGLLGLTNFGVYPRVDDIRIKNSLKDAASAQKSNINFTELKKQISHNMDLFFDTIKPLM